MKSTFITEEYARGSCAQKYTMTRQILTPRNPEPRKILNNET
jgi:hypothetical protein